MGYQTPVVFGRRETVFIVSPDFLSLPKKEIDVADGVQIKAGEFVDVSGQKATLGTSKKAVFLVTEDSFYRDMNSRNKPAGVVEGYFGEMLIRTKVYNEGGTAFSVGDKVTVVDGTIAHTDTDHTVEIGEITGRGADWIEVLIG